MKKSIGPNKKKTAVFISGTGSNLKSLIKFSCKKKSPIIINLIISSASNAPGLKYAKQKNIEKEYKKININKDAMFRQYKKLLFGYNQNLNFNSGGKFFQGKIIDLEKNGNLILCINNKKVSFEHGSLSLL